MAGEVGKGIAGGALSGAATGFTVGGPLGAAIGAVAGGLYGLGQGKRARASRMAADAADKAVDPNSARINSLIGKLDQLEGSYRAGTDPSSAFAKQGVGNALAQTQVNMVRAGLGNVNNLLRSNQQAATGYQQISAGAAQNADRIMDMSSQLKWNLDQRIYDRQLQRRAAAMATAATREQEVNNLFAQGLGTAPQLAGSFTKKQPAPTTNRLEWSGSDVALSPDYSALYNYKPAPYHQRPITSATPTPMTPVQFGYQPTQTTWQNNL